MRRRWREDGEALGHALLQPCREFRSGVAVGRDELGEGGFGLRRRGSVPDGAQLGADAMRLRIARLGA